MPNLNHLMRLMVHKSKLQLVRPWWLSQLLALVCIFNVTHSVDAGAVDYWAPWVTELATDSATINWRGDQSETATLEYASERYYNEHQSFDNAIIVSEPSGHYNHVTLTGLESNTAYVYKVSVSTKPSAFKNRAFRTMPLSGPFTFLVLSDSHAQEKRFKYVADAIAKNEKDALFILDGGDFASWDAEADWSKYFHYADKMLAKFPLVNTIGNHEYHNRGDPTGSPTAAYHYHWTYNIPRGAPLRYAFDCSNIRFVILDSPDPNITVGDDPQTSLILAKEQQSWLASQLDNQMAGTFTIHHHPIWESQRTTALATLRPWEKLYQTYRISANFAGHVHNYQRYSVHGIPFFVVGNAGGVFTGIKKGPHAPGYIKGKTRRLGYLKVTVDPENNRATAKEIFVASVKTDTSTKAKVYDPPVIYDEVTFPLSSKVEIP